MKWLKRWRWPTYVQWMGWTPCDIWIGVFVDRGWVPGEIAVRRTRVYVCLLPCFPIRLTWVDR